jgi:hypothetical protein
MPARHAAAVAATTAGATGHPCRATSDAAVNAPVAANAPCASEGTPPSPSVRPSPTAASPR